MDALFLFSLRKQMTSLHSHNRPLSHPHSVSGRLVTELPVFPGRVLLSLPDLGFLFASVFFLEVMKMPWLSWFSLEEVISSTHIITLQECESYFAGLAWALFQITHLVNSFH